MDCEKERREAIQAGEKALYSLRAAQDQLISARNWGFFDIFGGGMLPSLIKHSKVNNARVYIERARYDLRCFSRELQDVSNNLDLNIDMMLTFFDVTDHFFADLLVQCRIADASNRIEEAIHRVEDVLYRLRYR